MQHTPECVAKFEAANTAIATWKALWPSHCRNCGGTGSLMCRGDSVPYGSTWINLPDFEEPCPACIENGTCPRCGQSSGCVPSCHHCEWTGLDEGDRCPPEAECFCWVDEAERAEKKWAKEQDERWAKLTDAEKDAEIREAGL